MRVAGDAGQPVASHYAAANSTSSMSVESLSSARELFTRLDTGHFCRRSFGAGLSSSTAASPFSQGSKSLSARWPAHGRSGGVIAYQNRLPALWPARQSMTHHVGGLRNFGATQHEIGRKSPHLPDKLMLPLRITKFRRRYDLLVSTRISRGPLFRSTTPEWRPHSF